MKSILVATKNRKKADELVQLLGEGWKILVLLDIPEAPDVIENGWTFDENAAKKAVGIASVYDGLVLGDDSGLEVDALHGAPGIYSARYAGRHGDDEANNAKLIEELAEVPEGRRGAQFRCSIAVARRAHTLFETNGICRGTIVRERRGSAGFGYDPIFVPEGYTQTFAELDSSIKNTISHRAQAMKNLKNWLTQAAEDETLHPRT